MNNDSDTRPAIGIVNVLGNVEVVSADWDNEVTEVRSRQSLGLLLDSCCLKPRKSTLTMKAVQLPTPALDIDLVEAI